MFTLFLATVLSCNNFLDILHPSRKTKEKKDIAFILSDIDSSLSLPACLDSVQQEFNTRVYPGNQPKPIIFSEIDEEYITKKFGKNILTLVKEMRKESYDIIPYLEDENFCFYNDIKQLRKKYNKKSKISEKRYWELVDKAAKRYIDKGTRFILRNYQTLGNIVLQEGANPYYITAIYGIETNFGTNKGNRIAFNSWATIYKDFPKDRHKGLNALEQLKELIDFAEESKRELMEIKGSFMGCIGDCQTLPNNRKRFGVDYDKDGVIDPFVMEDNLAFIAKYLDDCGFSWNKWRSVYAYNHQKFYADVVTVVAREIEKNYKKEKEKLYDSVLKEYKNHEAEQDITKLFQPDLF